MATGWDVDGARIRGNGIDRRCAAAMHMRKVNDE
jgi:hypothetical protein